MSDDTGRSGHNLHHRLSSWYQKDRSRPKNLANLNLSSSMVIGRGFTNMNISNGKRAIEEYKSNNLLPLFFVGYFFASIFINLTLGLLIVIISSVVLYSDSKNIGAGKHCEKETLSPITWKPFSWLLFTIFFWIISYPYYMIKRKEIWEMNLGYSDI
ncbi:hypothetical protein [Methanohalophilus sp. DAL1]|uniref:hypothetical protein n=1 Tax=Methanohalophilus sp. DAL1 TaxID=1864608 RepID=UPI0008180CA7|nr:hypothetical protein [Methanohalophilus sp. DAL1]OBZ36074.1 MAG: hypothetical protein A9957_04200 [Methanohalophilus sp. DAL1]